MKEKILSILKAILEEEDGAVERLIDFFTTDFANERDPKILHEVLSLCESDEDCTLGVDDEEFYPAVTAAVQHVEDLFGNGGTFKTVIEEIDLAFANSGYASIGDKLNGPITAADITKKAMLAGYAHLIFRGLAAVIPTTATTTEG